MLSVPTRGGAVGFDDGGGHLMATQREQQVAATVQLGPAEESAQTTILSAELTLRGDKAAAAR
jgi:hypothetical protein